MQRYAELGREELESLLKKLMNEYEAAKAKGLKLDMSRGKPEKRQLDLSEELLSKATGGYIAPDGTDYRNYGLLDGVKEAKKIMADLLEVNPDDVFVGGNSSLALMHDCLAFAWIYGLPESDKPWGHQKVKFICPTPGYDRHFNMTEHFGAELISIPMTANGPDMDALEEAVKDPQVKGIWCIPKYSNPQGITYSDETVRRFAALSPAAPDFRIFWDNAYAVHAIDPDNPDVLLNLMTELKKTGKENMAFMFTSTSKITFAGAGISAASMSKSNMAWFKEHKFFGTIGYDKMNQLKHAQMLPDMPSILGHMRKHAEILRPKFDAVLAALEPLGAEGIAVWDVPHGGYFISVDVLSGCASRVVELCKNAGVVLTPAGSTQPYGKDPEDKNIRIAPTYPDIAELNVAVELFCLCVRIASAENRLSRN